MQNRDNFYKQNQPFEEQLSPPADYDSNELLTGQLTSEELKRAQEIANNLTPSSYESVIAFGREAQVKVQQFSSGLMQATRKADPLKVQKILEEMAEQIEQINPDDFMESTGGFFSKLFKKQKRTMQQTVSEYRKLSKYVDRLAIQLKHAQDELFMQQRQLNALFDENTHHFQELAIHIRAAQMKANELKNKTTNDDNAFDEEHFGKALSTHHDMISWIDQMLYNLQLSQEVSRQSAFQIRMVQQTNQMLIEKVQASIMATIPLWQGQIGTILSMGNQQRAAKMQESFANNAGDITHRLDHARERIREESKKTTGKVSASNIEQFKATQLRLLDEIEEALKLELGQANK